jgi:SAM-dependent methyltransferase
MNVDQRSIGISPGTKSPLFSSLRPMVKRVAGKSVPLACLAYIADNWLRGRRLARGDIETSSGTHAALDAAAVVDYGTRVWLGYRERAGIQNFTGRVAEIGPGDNDVVAWQLLGHGAAEVHLVDRYVQPRNPSRDKECRLLVASDPAVAAILPPDGSDPSGIYRHNGQGAETFFRDTPASFDAILSCAVLPYVNEPIGALSDMANALRPGGVMVHILRLSDIGMFSGMPPLTFLTVPGWIWPAMTSNSPRTNRVGLSAYRKWLAGSGLDGTLKVTSAVGSDAIFELDSIDEAPEPVRARAFAEVARVRPKLARSHRGESDADLAAACFFLVARKPQEQ